MDVMTAKRRAMQFKQSRLKNNESQKISAEKIIENNIKDIMPKFTPMQIVPVQKEEEKEEEKGVRQKNIQLRVNQIKSLREYTFKSGDLKGAQLNESQICRVALDLLFWLNINPSSVETEEELLSLVKKNVLENNCKT